MKAITDGQADVLQHTSHNGRYVTGAAEVLAMAEAGLLHDHGPQALAGGDHYLTMTSAGRQALGQWREAQPKPKAIVPRRRTSRAFVAWQTYREVYGRISFGEFWKEIWPDWRHQA